MRRAGVGISLVLVLALAACGSTVQVKQVLREPGSETGGSLASSPVQPGSSALPNGSESGPSSSGSVTGGTTGAGTPGALTTGGTVGRPAGPQGLTATYPGVTATQVYVGLSAAKTTASTGSDIGGSFGIGGFSQSTDKPLQAAMLTYINKHGGINGRRLVAVYHSYSGTDTRAYADQSQETCSAFTDDHKVFAHLADVSDPSFFRCMEQHGTVGVELSELGSQQMSERYPGVFSLADLNYTTASWLTVRALVRTGFLSKKSRIGLIQTDSSDFDLARQGGFDKAMKAAGLTYESYRLAPVTTSTDAAAVVSGANSAVLKFHTDGVDRVLFLTPYGGLLDAIFMKDASSQHYYPKYGLSSHDAPVALGGGNAPKDELTGAQGIGWGPLSDFTDVPTSQVPASVPLCLKIFKDANIAVAADRGQLNQRLSYCGSFLLFASIARKAGPQLTRTSFIAAGQSLGTVFNNPLTISGFSKLGPGSHQGVAEYQPISYVDACDCFRPAGAVLRFR